MKKLNKIQLEIGQFGIYFTTFIILSIIILTLPNYSHIDNFITYIMGVFSILLLLQMAYIEKLLKDKKDDVRKDKQMP